MGKRSIASAYKDTDQLLTGQPFNTARDFKELDELLGRVLKLQSDLKKKGGRTKEKRLSIKQQILEAIEGLDHAAPVLFRAGELKRKSKTEPAKGYSDVAALVKDILDAEHNARFAPDSNTAHQFSDKAVDSLRLLEDALLERRQMLQPKRPRLDPRRVDAMADVNINLYSPFARAMAASAKRDRATKEGAKVLRELPHIDHVAKEIQAFVAMLDFSQAVDEVVRECTNSNVENQDKYWNSNKQRLKMSLARANAEFNHTIQPLNLTVTASDPTLRTSRFYEEYIDAERRVEHAESLSQIKHAQQQLKAIALDFILGGEDKDNGIPHHKLFTRIKAAYRADKKLVDKKAEEYEARHDIDRTPFDNPLARNVSHVLNRVYEARWALADDYLADVLHRNFATLADHNVAPDNDKPKGGPVYQVSRKGRLARGRNERDIGNGAASVTSEPHMQRSLF